MVPVPQDCLTEQPIMKKTTSEERATHTKTKWSYPGEIQEPRREHKLLLPCGVPEVRQSILAIFKTLCKIFTGYRPLASTLPHFMVVRSRDERFA